MHPGKSGVHRTPSPVSLDKKAYDANCAAAGTCCRSRNAGKRIKKTAVQAVQRGIQWLLLLSWPGGVAAG